MSLKNKVILVTGASRGIGKAIAERFSNEGAIAIITSRNLKEIKDVSKRIKNSFPVELDVADKKSVKSAVQKIISRFKRIDILINNAGIVDYGTLLYVDY